MAIINPSNLYSGGQGLLKDNVVDYITKLELHKRAKDEALDKYYQNLPATINEKGVRDQDIPGLHQKINETQQYWMENRDKIKKGNTPESFNYNRMWRDVKGGVTMSQNAAGTSLKLGSARLDPKKAYMFKGADKEDMLMANELPVWDANHKNIDLAQFSSVQPLDTKKHLQPLDKIKANDVEPRYEKIDGDPYNKMEIREKKYSPDDLSAVYVYSQEQLNNNGGFEKALETAVQNPETAAQLTDLFKRQYGREPKSENDLAAAYTLSLKGDASPVYRKVEDFGAKQSRRMEDRLKAMGKQDEYIRGRMKKANDLKKLYYDYTQTKSKEADEGIVTKYIDLLKKDAPVREYMTINGEKYGKGRFVSPSVTIADKYTVTRDTEDGQNLEKVKPDAIYLTEDGKISIPVRFKRDKDGKVLKTTTGATQLDTRGFNPIPTPNLRVEIAKDIIQKKNQGSEVIDEFTEDLDPEFNEHIKVIETESTSSGSSEKSTKPNKWEKYRKP